MSTDSTHARKRQRHEVLYQINIPLPDEYSDAFHDALRMFVIQFTIFLMYYISYPGVDVAGYVTLQAFMLVGIAMYWLVVRKLIKINMVR
jgi:hypothetical protein